MTFWNTVLAVVLGNAIFALIIGWIGKDNDEPKAWS